MKTLVSKTHNFGICPKGLIYGFGQKWKHWFQNPQSFSSFFFYRKQAFQDYE